MYYKSIETQDTKLGKSEIRNQTLYNTINYFVKNGYLYK